MTNDTPPVNPAAQVFTIVIEYAPATGNIQCRAPQDPVLSLGMLSFAQEIVIRRGGGGGVQKSRILRPV